MTDEYIKITDVQEEYYGQTMYSTEEIRSGLYLNWDELGCPYLEGNGTIYYLYIRETEI